MNTFFFYTRISTITQSASRQIENFRNHEGFNTKMVYMDKIQGNVPFMQRPEASKLFDEVTSSKERVTVVVDSLDRIGRNLLDILNTIQVFTTNGINIKSLKEGFTTLLEDGTENPMAKLVVSVMGSLAELEKNRINQRVREGCAVNRHKFKGRKLGAVQTTEKLLTRHSDILKKLQKR